jgi:hypothetical protein
MSTTAPGDIGSRSRELDHLVGSGDADDAVRRLIDFVDDFGHSEEVRHEALVLSGMWRSLCESERKRAIKDEDARVERRRTLSQILQIKQITIVAMAKAHTGRGVEL